MIKRAKIAQTYLNWRLFNFLNLKGINNPDGEITNKKERHDLSSGFRAILKSWNKSFIFRKENIRVT